MTRSIIFALVIILCITFSTNAAIARKLKSIRSNALKKTCQFLDQENFKNNILKPFLIKRVPDTDGNRIVREHIVNFMRALDWTIELDQFTDTTPLGTKSFTNVVAVKNPQAAKRLSLACHYDSKLFNDINFIGASDSAIPCAILLHLASGLNSILSTSDQTDLSLELLFFDGEEAFVTWTATDSIYGARHLAAKWAEETFTASNGQTVNRLQAIEAFVLLDLIGPEDTVFGLNFFKSTEKLYERLQKIEMKVMKENLLEPASMFQGRQTSKYFRGGASGGNGGVEDDHIPFLQRNVPILHLISYPFPKVWHQASDNEASIHYPTVFNIEKIIRVFVIEYLHLTP